MPRVQVVVLRALGVPDLKSGVINPSQSIASIKKAIVNAFPDLELGSPEDWILAVGPGDHRQSLANYAPSDNDVFYLMPKEASEEPAFVPDP